MADLGFMPAVTQILDAVPASGQRMLFSATLDEAVDQLVRRYLSDPVTLSVDAATASVATMAHLVVRRAGRQDPRHRRARRAAGTDPPLRPHAARRRPGRRAAARGRSPGRSPARRAHPGSADPDPGRLQGRVAAGPGRHRCRGPRHPRRRRRPGAPGRSAERRKEYLHRAGRTARAGGTGQVVTLVLPQQRRTCVGCSTAPAYAGSTPRRRTTPGCTTEPDRRSTRSAPRTSSG